tara:strand:- start:15495 stop:16622 length:1128 start_codon:yes stop_codon:yes gene_type:complete
MANGNKPVPQPGRRQPAPAAQGANLAELLQLLGPMRQQEQANMAAMAREGDKSIPRQGVPGEIRGQGLGDPTKTGLTGYFNEMNPQMRPGEYDPTGAKSNRRRNLGYAREDALADMQFRNEYAQGLMDLRNKMGGQQGQQGQPGQQGEIPTGGSVMDHNVFDTLFPTDTRESRRFAQIDAEQAARDAYARATGRTLQEGEALPARRFEFRPGESPREQRIEGEARQFDDWRQMLTETPADRGGYMFHDENSSTFEEGDIRLPMMRSDFEALPPGAQSAIIAGASEAGVKDFGSFILDTPEQMRDFRGQPGDPYTGNRGYILKFRPGQHGGGSLADLWLSQEQERKQAEEAFMNEPIGDNSELIRKALERKAKLNQ